MKRVILNIVAFFLLSLLASGQGSSYSIDFGIGSFHRINTSFENNDNDFYSVGFNYRHNILNKSVLKAVKFGATYDYREDLFFNGHYLSVPVGLEGVFAKYFIVGTGITNKLLISYKKKETYPSIQDYEEIRSYQFMGYVNSGLNFGLTKNISISVYYQYNFDITTMYSEIEISKAGSEIKSDVKGRDSFFKLEIDYKF